MSIATGFAYTLITLNGGACLSYLIEGNHWKALYWLAAFTLNICILNMK